MFIYPRTQSYQKKHHSRIVERKATQNSHQKVIKIDESHSREKVACRDVEEQLLVNDQARRYAKAIEIETDNIGSNCVATAGGKTVVKDKVE